MWHQIVVVGNAGRDAEMRYTPSGAAVTTVNVATTRKYTLASGEKAEETCWFRVITWGKLAEIVAQYVKKGNLILVEGIMKPDKETGNPRVWKRTDRDEWAAAYEVNASRVKFLHSKEHGAPAEAVAEEAPQDDIPF